MKAEMPLVPIVLSVLAYTRTTLATGPFVIKSLRPLRMYLSSRRTAVVAMEPKASDPAPGSVSPSAPIHEPSHKAGRYLFFKYSEALRAMLLVHRLSCAT